MSEFRFILGRRALIVFLAFLVVTGALLGVPATTRTLAETSPGSQESSSYSVDSPAAEELLLDPSGHSPLLQAGSGDVWTETNTLIVQANTPTARWDHAMATTPSGVLLFGGEGSSDRLNDTWLFNTATSTWGLLDTGSASPPLRYGHAMAATPSTSTPSGVLLFGGYGGSNLNDTWLYNTATNSWGLLDTGSASPPARYDHAMAATPSGVLLFGGWNGINRLNDTWLFNTATGTWGLLDTGSASPSARSGHAMAATPSGVLLFGGQGSSDRLNDTWLFNTATGTWGLLDTGSASPSARSDHAMAALPGGDVLLFGGTPGGNETWLFNTTSSTWGLLNTGSASPSARYSHAMATTPSGVLLFGGWNGINRFNDTWLFGPGGEPTTPTIAVTFPTAGEHWNIGTEREITWTSTGLNNNPLTILLARNGVTFTETIATGLAYTDTHYAWTVTGPGTINAKIRVQQDATEGTSPGFFTIADAYPYTGTSTLNTSDPVLEISGIDTGSGTLWVTPLDPQYTSDPNLDQFLQQTGKRSVLFFDIFQEGLTGTLTIVLHYTPQLGEETFVLYRWDGMGWVRVDGDLDPVNHTFTFTIDANDLRGTPFALGGDPVPAAMPGMSPWALALLSLSLLGAGGWWFSRRRRLA